MDELELVDNVETASEREELLNRIIAEGLNSLNTSGPDKELLDAFVSQSFDRVLPCWDHLSESIRFYIFKVYINDFKKFMESQTRGSN